MKIPKRKSIRSATYLDYVRSHACCSCLAAPPSVAHHFMEGGSGMGRKPDDTFTVPLCVRCHNHWHTAGRLPDMGRQESVALQYQNEAMMLSRWIAILGAIEGGPRDEVF